MDGLVEKLPHHLLRPRMQCDLFIFCRIGTHIVFLLVVFLWGPKLPFFWPLPLYEHTSSREAPARLTVTSRAGQIRCRAVETSRAETGDGNESRGLVCSRYSDSWTPRVAFGLSACAGVRSKLPGLLTYRQLLLQSRWGAFELQS